MAKRKTKIPAFIQDEELKDSVISLRIESRLKARIDRYLTHISPKDGPKVTKSKFIQGLLNDYLKKEGF